MTADSSESASRSVLLALGSGYDVTRLLYDGSSSRSRVHEDAKCFQEADAGAF